MYSIPFKLDHYQARTNPLTFRARMFIDDDPRHLNSLNGHNSFDGLERNRSLGLANGGVSEAVHGNISAFKGEFCDERDSFGRSDGCFAGRTSSHDVTTSGFLPHRPVRLRGDTVISKTGEIRISIH